MLHIVLLIVSLVSLWIVGIVIFGWFPAIECNLTQERIELINGFSVDISLTILGSVLFYYLLVYYPEWRRNRLLFRLVKGNLVLTCELMENILLYLVYAYNVRSLRMLTQDLSETDFMNITHLSKETITYSYKDEQGSYPCFDGSTELGLLYYWASHIRSITDITKNPIFLLQKDSLIHLVKKINSSRLIDDINILHNNASVPITIGELNKSIYNFYVMYLKLSKLLKLKPSHSVSNRKAGAIPIIYN